MRVIDFHSHILPGIDDGSKSAEESCEMLGRYSGTAVDTIILTPHFYPTRDTPSAFLGRRGRALDSLLAAIPPDLTHPRLICGAEVAYFDAIGKSSEISSLAIEGTRLILIEMPFYPWTEKVFASVGEITDNLGLIPVMAHIERYSAASDRKSIERLSRAGALLQVSSSFFRFPNTRRALSMLRRGEIDFLGSDAHNLSTRPPDMEIAYTAIDKRLGGAVLDKFHDRAQDLFNSALVS